MGKLTAGLVVAALVAVSAASTAPSASASISLDAAARKDRRFEAWMLEMPVKQIRLRCWHGPHGNVGCQYFACVRWGNYQGSNPSSGVSGSLDLGQQLMMGVDEVARRHGRLRVLSNGWLTFWRRC